MVRIKVFLYANVLLAIANRPAGFLSQVLSADTLDLISSEYAFQEAIENLETHNSLAQPELEKLRSVVAVTDRISPLSPWVALHDEDRQILAAAIGAECDYLINYDRDFDALFGQTVGGVKIEHASGFVRLHVKN